MSNAFDVRSLKWPIRGGSAQKGYLFQASGILRVGKSLKGLTDSIYGCERDKKTFCFSNLFVLKSQ